MLISHAIDQSAETVKLKILPILESISESYLRECVKTLSIPRHFRAQYYHNCWVAQWITAQLQAYGYETRTQGKYANIFTLPPIEKKPCIIIGAHYDSVPHTPGADDNASAVAALLSCAKAIAEYAPETPICFVAFNREEDDLMGSKEFVRYLISENEIIVDHAHILEMVGYCEHSPNSQKVPSGLPIRIPTTGNFLGLIGNRYSNALVDRSLIKAKTYLPNFPVLGLKVHLGLENLFSVLKRSDHAPFWEAKKSALMWTDTAEFRNPNYHRPTDRPDTLDYCFLRQVTQLLLACVL
jgi:hypothetical protein